MEHRTYVRSAWKVFCLFFLSLLCTSNGYFTSRPIPDYACGAILESSSGSLESPLFPEPYPPEVDCFWQIRAPVGARIHVTSQIFYLEEDAECLFDSVLIQDGETGESARAVYCGTRTIDFLSDTNVVHIRFVSDVSNQDAGFQIHYELVSLGINCNITLREPGLVSSPGYPQPYPTQQVCLHYIWAPADFVISLEFHDFKVETSPCNFDKFEVYEGPELSLINKLGTFCGQHLPRTLTSSGNSMTLKLVTDADVETRGFNASVHFISTITTQPPVVSTAAAVTSTPKPGRSGQSNQGSSPVTFNGCNATLRTAIMNISSPRFPMKYPNDAFCVVKLRSAVISTFVVNFLNFNIEEEANCTYDSLTIYTANDSLPTSGTDSDSRSPLRRMCGSDITEPLVTAEGHGLDLVFKSDKSVIESGYLANVLITPVDHVESSCPDVCENGGTCVEVLIMDGSVDWKCQCAEGFTGILCDIIVPSCDRMQCMNGVCREEAGEAFCVCRIGYTGELCEERIVDPPGSPLYFTKMSGNMTLSLGSSVILECAVSEPQADVMWLFHDRILSATDFSRGVEVHPGGVVHIPEVRDEHSGRYTCMAWIPEELAERSLWIDLTEPCSLDVTKSPTNITKREGQVALFQCYVPNADVTLWRKDGDPIRMGPRKRILVNHYLMINPVVETDAGEYTCAARGDQGCFSRTSAFLTVETTGHGTACGRPSTRTPAELMPRISSGREAPAGSAPWHVVLREDRKGTTFCGGSLISPDTVLTAAHCVRQFKFSFGYPFHPKHIQVYLGTNHCEGKTGIYRQLKSYIVHPHFNDTFYNNDVALFKLDQPVTYSSDVMPICLERKDFVDELLKPGRVGVVTGCGRRYANGIPPTYLHEVQLPFVPREICQDRASVVNASVTPGMFCAGYARSMRGDACAGDSGGPFVIEFSGRSILVGIVSWGVDCDRENHYGYYTHAAHYYDWIMANMETE